MTRLCTRYIKNPDDVKDTLTEGFLKIFKKLPEFDYRGDGGLEGWIRKIMVNESLMFLRRNRQLTFIDIEEIPFEPGCELSQSLEAEEILKMIEALPAGYRTIFNLYAIEGYNSLHKGYNVQTILIKKKLVSPLMPDLTLTAGILPMTFCNHSSAIPEPGY